MCLLLFQLLSFWLGKHHVESMTLKTIFGNREKKSTKTFLHSTRFYVMSSRIIIPIVIINNSFQKIKVISDIASVLSNVLEKSSMFCRF